MQFRDWLVSNSRKGFSRKGHVRSTYWKLKSYTNLEDFVSVSQVRSSREILAKHSTQRIFKCGFFTLHPYYIYPHYSQKYERPFRAKNSRQVFYNTIQHNTPIFQKESYSSLVRNYCSLFSFPLPLSYLKRRFVSKQNSHIFKV